MLTADEMQQLAQQVFPAAESFAAGPWEARFTPGLDGTYTSVRATAEPPHDLEAALDTLRRWYTQRSTPLVLHLVDPHPLDLHLGSRGWTTIGSGLVMCRALRSGGFRTSEHMTSAELGEDGVLRISVAIGGEVAGTGEALALRGPSGEPVAVGLRAVTTAEKFRRRGVASHVIAAAEEWAASMGATSVALMVLRDNVPAITLYEGLGYAVHHRYRFIEEVAR